MMRLLPDHKTPPDADRCRSQADGIRCQRAKKHEGMHAARDGAGTLSWSDSRTEGLLRWVFGR